MKRDRIPADPRGGHVRLYWALIDSPAWGSLSATDQRAWIALRRALGKTNNGDLSLPLSRARHYRITSPATLAKALRGLVAVGLIAVTRRGGCTRGGQRLPTLYRFTDEQVFPMPGKLIDGFKATNDWEQVASIDHGKALIRETEKAAHDLAEKKRLLQFPNGTPTDGVAVRTATDTDLEAWRLPPVRKVKSAKGQRTGQPASTGAGLGTVAAPN